MQLEADGLGGVRLVERDVEKPWIKDYDAESGGGPATWLERFDVTRWGLIAVLRDLRVAPAARGRGVGAALVDAVQAWARERGCADLEVETQNINVPACRFYARQGFQLAALDRFAYPDLPEETQLLWRKWLR